MRRIGLLIALAILLAVHSTVPANGLSLKMQPLIYKDTLAKGEKKKGFIDISNPSRAAVRLKTSVQAFRQTDDQGALEFYDEQQVAASIRADLDEFELGPREAIRMYFQIDGTKLPTGDVFAALFVATTSATPQTGAVSSLRLGTLFTLVNGTPGPRRAEITDLRVPFWQFGKSLQGSYSIKNVAKAGEATGFYPGSTIAIDPLHTQQQSESKLVFAGRTRQNDFTVSSARLGFYKVSVAYGQSVREQWVFMATGYWLTVVVLGILLLGTGLFLWWRLRKQRSRLNFRQ